MTRYFNSTAVRPAVALTLTAALTSIIIYYSYYTSKHEKSSNSKDKKLCLTAQNDTTDSETEYDSSRTKNQKNIPCEINTDTTKSSSLLRPILSPGTITIAYASTTGTCTAYAQSLHSSLLKQLPHKDINNNNSNNNETHIQICTVDEFDWWDELLNYEGDPNITTTNNLPPIIIWILPTWTNGALPPKYNTLTSSLHDLCNDWRVEPKHLQSKNLHIATFGMGSSAYDSSTFCKPAKDVFSYMMKLGCKSLLTRSCVKSSNKAAGMKIIGMGDHDSGDCNQVFHDWKNIVVKRIHDITTVATTSNQPQGSSSCCSTNSNNNSKGLKEASSCACKENSTDLKESDGCCNSNYGEEKQPENNYDQDEDSSFNEEDDDYDDDEDDFDEEKEPEVMDLEDIGNAMQQQPSKSKVGKEMVTPKQAAALKKEGYRIIGTHSAVKLCRWTKHQLRGRGGCYKHTFYGITSYQCMEATPSLACANKCVFCWRHHKNPVGREWRWKTDDPYEIVDQAVQEHISMIKETKGIPGVKMDRWQEAHTVRHCALSLVGEPIMYPRIDEFLGELHRRSISTFLVTNGQHPQAIGSLRPITQLYVSVDASTPETLEAIDRPLFKDAWDRLKQSLTSLKNKGQRTVARLTVVKGWNSGEVEGYAKLIALGHCSLVEVKGVTFCGKSDASNLNMSNTPWHHEVVELTQSLQKELAKLREASTDENNRVPEYEIACEHKHSCSVLLARVDQFAVDDPVTGKRKWRTWINYPKFHELAARNAMDPTFKFGVKDYVEDTPSWALFGSNEEGFDPTDLRHRKKNKYPKYTQFDADGIPTHDDNGAFLSEEDRSKLRKMMEDKKREIGDGVSVIESRGGEKILEDASLMFRGLTITR